MIQRIITGTVLGLLVLAVIFLLPKSLFPFLTGVIFLIAAQEWCFLSGVKKSLYQLVYLLCVGCLMYVVIYLPMLIIFLVAALFWLVALLLVITYPKSGAVFHHPMIKLLFGFFVLVPSWLALNVIQHLNYGSYLLLLFILLVSATDIGAYFSGRYLGKTKLCRHVSPNKTWEGCIGGFILSLLVALISLSFLHPSFSTWLASLCMIIILNISTVTGDLFESMLKRAQNIKDSGNWLPGHGGLMDRLDSITAAAPIFILIIIGLLHIMSTSV